MKRQEGFSFNGFEPANTTPVPDVLFDELLPFLSEAELKTLLYIIRRTSGFKKTDDAISLGQFQHGITKHDGEVLDHGCGIKNRTTIKHALDSLEAKGCIKSDKRDDPLGDKATTVYRVQFCSEGVVRKTYHGSTQNVPPVVTETYHGSTDSALGVVRKTYPQETVIQETDSQENVISENLDDNAEFRIDNATPYIPESVAELATGSVEVDLEDPDKTESRIQAVKPQEPPVDRPQSPPASLPTNSSRQGSRTSQASATELFSLPIDTSQSLDGSPHESGSTPAEAPKNTRKRNQSAKVIPIGPPVMPALDAQWCAEIAVEIAEARNGRRYGETTRAQELSEARKVLRLEYHDTSITRDHFILAWDEMCSWAWWKEHSVKPMIKHLRKDDKIITILEELATKPKKSNGGTTSSSNGHTPTSLQGLEDLTYAPPPKIMPKEYRTTASARRF